MADKTKPTVAESDQIDELVEEAEDLIATEELWRGQILYTGVELGLFDVLVRNGTGSSWSVGAPGESRSRGLPSTAITRGA